MTIKNFLQQTIDGKLSIQGQKEYLLKTPFGNYLELAEAVEFLLNQMPPTPNLPGAIDICGTGGSGLNRINTSTISAFIVSACGVSVAKHGNNASSGRFGSFDLLSGLDVPINLSNSELELRYQQYGLAFIYARNFHPTMRFFAPLRAELSTPTFFNILGPLLSPVKASKQIIGTSSIENARLIAETAEALGKDHVIVVVGCDGLDEVTLSGPSHIIELKDKSIKDYTIKPEDFDIKPIENFSEIAGSSPEQNIAFAQNILQGSDRSRRTDLVLVNSALTLYLAGKSHSLPEGFAQASKALKDGSAYQQLKNYRLPSVLKKIILETKKRKFVQSKREKPSILKYSGGLIAEIKRKSPSDIHLNRKVDVKDQALQYEKAGAAAISVLCEPNHFGGSFEDLKLVSDSVGIPVLCKDFIVSKTHIDQAKSAGADIILLIIASLDDKKLYELFKYAKSLGLDVLVEVHSKSETLKALAIKPSLIGINSRNLHDFSIKNELFSELKPLIPQNILVVAESGIKNYRDIPKNCDGVLVGSALMKHPFTRFKIKELRGRPILKLCGIRSKSDAKLCELLCVDMIGINFAPRSRRRVDLKIAKDIASQCRNTVVVGVFENQDPIEINKIAQLVGVDAVQLSGKEALLDKISLPIIKTIRLGEQKPATAFMSILDSNIPGSGKSFDHELLSDFEPSLIAGGVSLSVAKKLLKTKKPLGIDTASGIETRGVIDPDKIKAFVELLKKTSYH